MPKSLCDRRDIIKVCARGVRKISKWALADVRKGVRKPMFQTLGSVLADTHSPMHAMEGSHQQWFWHG